jgi:hypothetical protein
MPSLAGKYRIILAVLLVQMTVLVCCAIAWGHEVVGEVTPLMLHTNHTLTFIKNNRGTEAISMAQVVYEDFQVPMREGNEAGLKTSSQRVDRSFGTFTYAIITESLESQDLRGLRKGLEFLSFLLMLEKFDVLQGTLGIENVNLTTQKTIFWLGRNYFSYLLEPTMGEQDPIEEKRLDRHLDRMLYSLEDGEWEKFVQLRNELTEGIVNYFQFPQQKY